MRLEISVLSQPRKVVYSEIIKKYDYVDLLIPIFNKDGSLDAAKPILGASFVFIKKEEESTV